MTDRITDDDRTDGIDRRGFLKCMAWAGSGLLLHMQGGVLTSSPIHEAENAALASDFSFAQISDSHIGFNKAANTDVVGTLRAAIDRINALPAPPDFMLHTGDISHLTRADEFDTAEQILRRARVSRVYYVPGEHDVITDNGSMYRGRFGKDTLGGGWYSFDHKGAHFVGLVNVLHPGAGGLGWLGPDQLSWLEKDLKWIPASTPVVLFAHIPLWSVYPPWGWGTDDSVQALSYVRRFGSVTVLNGHIHQVMQKVEGNIMFHTARSTAFPQPAPGQGPAPGPMTVAPGVLRTTLGVTSVSYVRGGHALAVIDSTLANPVVSGPPVTGTSEVTIRHFRFMPDNLRVARGTTVTWVNEDDSPHTIASRSNVFKSGALDTDDRFRFTFRTTGVYPYYCSIHPMMTGQIEVA